MNMPWVVAPSFWIKSGGLRNDFSGNTSVSTDIAALKIFIYFCMKAERVKSVNESFNLKHGINFYQEHLKFEATYDEISEACKLSRALIARGIRKLVNSLQLDKIGSTKKVVYNCGFHYSGWFKLPCRPLLAMDNKVSSFLLLGNRDRMERDALKLYLYLLSVRSNQSVVTAVSHAAITNATGMASKDLEIAEVFLVKIGLLDGIKNLGLKRSRKAWGYQEQYVYEYSFVGSYHLNKVVKYVQSDNWVGPATE